MKFSIRSFQFAATSPKSTVTRWCVLPMSSPSRRRRSGATKSSNDGAPPLRSTKIQSCHVADRTGTSPCSARSKPAGAARGSRPPKYGAAWSAPSSPYVHEW